MLRVGGVFSRACIERILDFRRQLDSKICSAFEQNGADEQGLPIHPILLGSLGQLQPCARRRRHSGCLENLKANFGVLQYPQRVAHRPHRIGHEPKKFLLLLCDELAHLGELHYPGNRPSIDSFGFGDRSFVFAVKIPLLNGQNLGFWKIGSPPLCGLAGGFAGIHSRTTSLHHRSGLGGATI
jgi:hypothetical protein